VLRRVADEVPVEDIPTSDFQAFLDAMQDTLNDAEGVGLAAPQVFVSRRVFLASVLTGDDDAPDVEFFINPRIVEMSEPRRVAWEGCLSFRDLLVKVPRANELTVEYLNRLGRPMRLKLRGYPARIIQHEYDHLDGVLTLDRARSTRDIILASEVEAAEGDEPSDEFPEDERGE
jgi:peptide deformylase